MNADNIYVLLSILAIILGAIASFIKWVYPHIKKVSQMAHDFVGYEARPGFDRKAGVMERLKDVEQIASEAKELAADAAYNSKPNGGNSAYDHLMKQNQDDKIELQGDIAAIATTVARHINESEADRSGIHREINLIKFDRSENHNESQHPNT